MYKNIISYDLICFKSDIGNIIPNVISNMTNVPLAYLINIYYSLNQVFLNCNEVKILSLDYWNYHMCYKLDLRISIIKNNFKLLLFSLVNDNSFVVCMNHF